VGKNAFFYVFTDISDTVKSVKSTRSIDLDIFARRKQTTSVSH